MKTIIFFALCYCVLNLFKDLLKGFKSNPEDVYFDIFSVFVTLIPFVIELITFCKKDINHWKHFQIGLSEAILMSYFPRWIQKRLERGNHFYCNHCKLYPKNFTNYNFIYFSESDSENLSWRLWHSGWLNFENIQTSQVCKILEILKKFLNREIAEISSMISVTFVENCLKITYQSTDMKVKIEEIYIEDTLNFNLMLIEIKKLFLQSLQTFWFKIGDLQVIVESNRIRVKHVLNNSDEGTIYERLDNIDQLILFCDILQYWKMSEDCGIISESSSILIKEYLCKPYCDKVKILHTINLQKIISNLKSNISICLIQIDQGFRFRCEGEIVNYDQSHTLNKSVFPNLENNIVTSENRLDMIDENTMDTFYYYSILSNEIKKKFGEALGDFLINYTRMFFNKVNSKALLFILKRTSCWRYRDIGRNWESKRYLADINYILEVSGLPRFTHIDRKVEPTKRIRMLRDSIPKTPMIIKREIIDFKPILKMPKKAEIISSGQDFGEVGKNFKNIKTFLKLINKSSNYGDNDASKRNAGSASSTNDLPRLKNRSQFFKNNVKIVSETDDYKSLYPSLKMDEKTSRLYDGATKSSMNFKDALKCSKDMDIVKSVKEKITMKYLTIKKDSEIVNLKNVEDKLIKDKTTSDDRKNKTDGWIKVHGSDYRKNDINVEQDLVLENSFSILSDYLEPDTKPPVKFNTLENLYFLDTVEKLLIGKNFSIKKIKYILNSFKFNNKCNISKNLLDEIISHFLTTNLIYLDSEVILQKISSLIIKPSNVFLMRPFKRLRPKKPIIPLSKKMMKYMEKKNKKKGYNFVNEQKKKNNILKRKNDVDYFANNPNENGKRLKKEKSYPRKIKEKCDVSFHRKLRKIRREYENLNTKDFCLDSDYLINETIKYFHSKDFSEKDFTKYPPNPKTIKLWQKLKEIILSDSSLSFDFRILPALPNFTLIDNENLSVSAKFYKAFKENFKGSHKSCYFLIS